MSRLTLRQIERVASELPKMAAEMRRRVNEQFAAYVREELVRQHYSGKDLYGRAYPKPKRGGQPMLDTGELAGGYEVRATNKGIAVENLSAHTIVNHDDEHVHLPDERGMPERWRKKLEQIKAVEARRLLDAIRAK